MTNDATRKNACIHLSISCLSTQSATTLLPGQDKLAPSIPMSGAAWFVVSCGFRLSEVG